MKPSRSTTWIVRTVNGATAELQPWIRRTPRKRPRPGRSPSRLRSGCSILAGDTHRLVLRRCATAGLLLDERARIGRIPSSVRETSRPHASSELHRRDAPRISEIAEKRILEWRYGDAHRLEQGLGTRRPGVTRTAGGLLPFQQVPLGVQKVRECPPARSRCFPAGDPHGATGHAGRVAEP